MERVPASLSDPRTKSSRRLAMNGELNFEAMPFEAFDEFQALASGQSGFDLEGEFSRRSRSRGQGFAPRAMCKRLGPLPVRPGKPKKLPVHLPPFLPLRSGGASIATVGPGPSDAVPGPSGGPPGPLGTAAPEPYGAAPEPYPAEPLPV